MCSLCRLLSTIMLVLCMLCTVILYAKDQLHEGYQTLLQPYKVKLGFMRCKT